MINKKYFSIVMAITIVLIVFSYFYLDQTAAWWCHENISESYKKIFQIITEFGNSIYYLIGFSLAFLLFHFLWKKPEWANISGFLFASVAISGIVGDIIKVIAGRYRPSELFEHGEYGFTFFHIHRAMTSFPSGHTVTVFSLAMAVTYFWPKWSLLVWICALLIGISRVVINAHYPSDIIAGVFIGVFSTLLLIRYYRIKIPIHSES